MAAIADNIVKMTEPVLATNPTKKRRKAPITNRETPATVVIKACFNISFIRHNSPLFNFIINYIIFIIKNQLGAIHFCIMTWAFN